MPHGCFRIIRQTLRVRHITLVLGLCLAADRVYSSLACVGVFGNTLIMLVTWLRQNVGQCVVVPDRRRGQRCSAS